MSKGSLPTVVGSKEPLQVLSLSTLIEALVGLPYALLLLSQSLLRLKEFLRLFRSRFQLRITLDPGNTPMMNVRDDADPVDVLASRQELEGRDMNPATVRQVDSRLPDTL